MNYQSEREIYRELDLALAELELEFEAQAQELAQEAEQEGSCPGPAFEIVDGFPRYSNSVTALPRARQDQVKALAQRIVDSFAPGCQPILRVTVVGHADRDLARESREPGYMQSISAERATAVMNELISLVGTTIAPQIIWTPQGAADASLVVENPVSEAQRMRNRRVEIEASVDPRSCESQCESDFQFCLGRASSKEERVTCGRKRRGCIHRCQGVPV